MSSVSRNNILARLRDGLGQAQPLTAADDTGQMPPFTLDGEERIQHFIDTMSAVKTEFYRTTEQEWPARLQQVLQDKNINRLLVSSERETGKALQENPGALELVTVTGEQGDKDKLFDIPASLTGCRSAIAETGSLVLWSSPEEPRAMSLVPPVHCVLLRTSQIKNTLVDVLETEGWTKGMPTNALLISGPSKTADIARILAYGAHGPRELVIMLIDDSE